MNNPRRIQRHLVKALAAGALLAAAALPLAIATAAGAAPAPTTVTFTPSGNDTIGSGSSGTVAITDGTAASFAADGGDVTVTSSAPGLTFSGATEPDANTVDASYTSTSATVPGSYTLTVTDDAGTGTTAAGAVVVTADPTFSTVSPAGIVDLATATPTPLTVSGSGFESGATVTISNATNGTTLASAATSTFTAGKTTTTGEQGTATYVSPTSLTLYVEPTNSVTGGAATIGAYTVTVTNPDGGSVTSGSVFTVSGNEISEVSPSAVPVPTGTASATPITISGSGFASSATLTLACATGVTATLATTGTVAGATSITDTLDVPTGSATGLCALTVTNTAPGNLASYDLAGAIGIGVASSVAPTITASSLSSAAAVSPGTPAQTITFTGTGFSQYTAPVNTQIGTTGTPDSSASIGTTAGSCLGGQSGTSLTCELTVSTGATTGAHAVDIAGTVFPAAFSVAGPVITSAAPAALAVGAPVGTIVALTGTGFGPTTTGTITKTSGTGNVPTGVFQNVSATQENFVLTAVPVGTTVDSIKVQSVDSYGDLSVSAGFAISVEAAPAVTSTTYATGTTGVGVGSKAQAVTVNGSGFATGATIGSFVNAAGVADPDVTGTVTAVNASGTQLTAAITVAAGDANTIDGFTITNTNGGTTKATAAAPAGLVIEAAPTITSVTPPAGTAASTSTFAIVGTGFQTGAIVSLTPGNGTCTTTFTSSTALSATCTLGSPGVTPTYLVVTNPDGGSATSTTAVLPATSATTTSGFRLGTVHGHGISGHTVRVTISGTGFYGQPKITSTAAGTRATVSHDTGKLLTVVLFTKAGVSGEHTFTVTLANGKHAKRNYSIVK